MIPIRKKNNGGARGPYLCIRLYLIDSPGRESNLTDADLVGSALTSSFTTSANSAGIGSAVIDSASENSTKIHLCIKFMKSIQELFKVESSDNVTYF